MICGRGLGGLCTSYVKAAICVMTMTTCPMGQLQIKPLKGPERFADRILFLGYPLRDFIYALEFLLPVNGSLIDMKMAEAADKLRYLLEYVPLAGN